MWSFTARDSALLPSVVTGWPSPLLRGSAAASPPTDSVALLARIRAEMLFWPALRFRARSVRALAVDLPSLARARASFADADIALTDDLAGIDPNALEAVFALPGPVRDWARLGGLGEDGEPPVALLARAKGRCPWTGAAIGVADALEAQALLRGAAMAARGPVRLRGMTRWKRRCLRPFLTGPDGAPRRVRDGWDDGPGPLVVWGSDVSHDGARAEAPDTLRVEDGFLRSVGLGLRHTPPLSLTIDAAPPYFDATRPNAFDAVVAKANFTPDLLARASRLRAAVTALGITKYNLVSAEPLPDASGREALLVAGQVARDASIRLGARAVRDDLALLRAARAAWPSAFILYKPHPDVATGLRDGAAPAAEARRFADSVVLRADPAACIAWADRVATITSLMGFEALLRRKAVSCFGRPFYAGWGLTDDADPPLRSCTLTLDELTAAALILYPRYVDPVTRLPCPPEIAIMALARAMGARRRPAARMARMWRDGVSWALNQFG